MIPAYSPGAGSYSLAGFGCSIQRATRQSGSPKDGGGGRIGRWKNPHQGLDSKRQLIAYFPLETLARALKAIFHQAEAMKEVVDAQK